MRPLPACKILVALMAGITLQWMTGWMMNDYWCFLLPSILLLTLWWESRFRHKVFRSVYPASLCTWAVLLTFGMVVATRGDSRSDPLYYAQQLKAHSILAARLLEPPTLRGRHWVVSARVIAIQNKAQWTPATGKLLLYIDHCPGSDELQYGDVLYLHNKVQEIPGPANPYEFDYRKHLEAEDTYREAFLKWGDWTKAGSGDWNPVYRLAYSWRDIALQRLRNFIPQREEEGVAEAVVLGYRGALNRDLQSQYINVGLVHILVVAGLHTGMLLGALAALFKFLIPHKKKGWLLVLLLLGSAWLFALVSGMNVPVLRAVYVFSFSLAGGMLRKPKNSFNVLAVSALCILLPEPATLTDPAMQLSYGAVCGILLLQKPVGRWLHKVQPLRFLNPIINMCLGAQYGTLAISFFYFGQFPLYFLPANFFAIPLAEGVLITGMLLCFFGGWPLLGHLLGTLESMLIFLMDELTRWLNTWPMPDLLLQDFPLSAACCLGTAMLLIYFFCLKKVRKALMPALLLLLLSGWLYGSRIFAHRQQQLCFFSLQGETVISYCRSDSQVIVYDTPSDQMESLSGYATLFAHRRGIKHQWLIPWSDSLHRDALFQRSGNLFRFGGIAVGIVEGSRPLPCHSLNFLLIKGDPPCNPTVVSMAHSIPLILGNQNKVRTLRNWEAACPGGCFNLKNQGAYLREW